jgi:hypothetical protein
MKRSRKKTPGRFEHFRELCYAAALEVYGKEADFEEHPPKNWGKVGHEAENDRAEARSAALAKQIATALFLQGLGWCLNRPLAMEGISGLNQQVASAFGTALIEMGLWEPEEALHLVDDIERVISDRRRPKKPPRRR